MPGHAPQPVLANYVGAAGTMKRELSSRGTENSLQDTRNQDLLFVGPGHDLSSGIDARSEQIVAVADRLAGMQPDAAFYPCREPTPTTASS